MEDMARISNDQEAKDTTSPSIDEVQNSEASNNKNTDTAATKCSSQAEALSSGVDVKYWQKKDSDREVKLVIIHETQQYSNSTGETTISSQVSTTAQESHQENKDSDNMSGMERNQCPPLDGLAEPKSSLHVLADAALACSREREGFPDADGRMSTLDSSSQDNQHDGTSTLGSGSGQLSKPKSSPSMPLSPDYQSGPDGPYQSDHTHTVDESEDVSGGNSCGVVSLPSLFCLSVKV